MTNLRRVPVAWTTGPGGAGVSVFYTEDPDDVTTELATFFNAWKAKFHTAVTWSIPSSGDIINDLTGVLVGTWSGGTSANIAGTNSNAYAAGCGAYVNWLTGAIRNGRKLRGRTFMAPLIVTSYDTAGTIDNSFLAQMQTDSNTLAAAGKLVIWGRPFTPGASNGTSAPVSAAQVPDKVTSLRSRRS